jgi:hypothetical protein
MNFKARMQISDNVLESENCPKSDIIVANGLVVEQHYIHNPKQAYGPVPVMVGWSIDQLQKWIDQDYAGYHPENYYEMFVGGERISNIKRKLL